LTPIDISQIADNLEEFLRRRFKISERDSKKFNHKINLWEAGYVDSLGTVEVITHLENTFHVTMPPNALFMEVNTTIEGLASTVHAALAEQATAR
jgi:acyl carrier protein